MRKTIITSLTVAFSLSAIAAGSAFASSGAANAVINTGVSQNWAGYYAAADSSGSSSSGFTGATASWIVPTATVPAGSTSAGDATWIGIGGITSTDLIQAGTEAVTNDLGQLTYAAWYEALPGVSQTTPLVVHAGDSVTVSITEPDLNEWYIAFTDKTTGQSYDTSLPYTSSHSTVEWIEEMPSMAVQGSNKDTFIPLDNFGTVNFTNATAVLNGQTVSLAGAGAQTMNMENNSRQFLAAVSGVGADQESFSVTRSNAVATVGPATVTIGGVEGNENGNGHNGGGEHRRGVGISGYIPSSSAVGQEQSTTTGSVTLPSSPNQVTWVFQIAPNGQITQSGQGMTQSGQSYTITQLSSSQMQQLEEQQMAQINQLLSSLGVRFRF